MGLTAMTTTIVKVSKNSAGAQAAGLALRNAGIGVVEVDTWEAAQAALRKSDEALVVCDGEAIAALSDARPTASLPRDVARSLSHELRTPLSAMAGWLHLMESGKLDDAGVKRAIGKLRGNIDDQVRTIERYLGASQEGHD
jgi:signal transduction histidine kinase